MCQFRDNGDSISLCNLFIALYDSLCSRSQKSSRFLARVSSKDVNEKIDAFSTGLLNNRKETWNKIYSYLFASEQETTVLLYFMFAIDRYFEQNGFEDLHGPFQKSATGPDNSILIDKYWLFLKPHSWARCYFSGARKTMPVYNSFLDCLSSICVLCQDDIKLFSTAFSGPLSISRYFLDSLDSRLLLMQGEDKKQTKKVLSGFPFFSEPYSEYYDRKEGGNKFSLILKKNQVNSFSNLIQAVVKSMQDDSPILCALPELSCLSPSPDFLQHDLGPNVVHPSLIVFGSYWEGHSNKAFVFDECGKLLFTQEKLPGFVDKDGYSEDVDTSSGYCLHLVDLPHFGRIVVSICHDVLTEEYLFLLKKMRVDYLIQISYSTSKDIVTKTLELAQDNHFLCYFINPCCLEWEKDSSHPRLVAMAFGPKRSGKLRKINKKKVFCNKNCDACPVCEAKIIDLSGIL